MSERLLLFQWRRYFFLNLEENRPYSLFVERENKREEKNIFVAGSSISVWQQADVSLLNNLRD